MTLVEAREELQTIRRGLGWLLARFEPGRSKAVEHHLSTFGSRETLARLPVRERRLKSVPLRTHAAVADGGTVH